MSKVGVAFITHCAKRHLPHCLPPVLNSPLKPKVCVVNSSSNDGTVELAQLLGAETLIIPRDTFNHGTTRELARKALGTEIVVMMTPDAYLVNPGMLERLVDPIMKEKASVAYARQIPHEGADFFESFAREYNYPEKSHIRGFEDIATYGVYTYFCSDSCSAYSNKALDSIGGFSRVLIGEDTVACAKLINKGHRIAYTADALVKHSHRYTLSQEFQRHFDTGIARKDYQELISTAGKDEARGKHYVNVLFKKLLKEKPVLIPYAVAQTGAKWIGYKMGKMSHRFPQRWKKLFSGQDYYWK
jgi:rhamnosyltransferase